VKSLSWQIKFGFFLLAISVALFFLHYSLFHDARDIFFYLLHDIAFLPVDVLIVTLVIHRLLNQREKRAVLKKMNMVIGAFFSEVGNPMLRMFIPLDQNIEQIRPAFSIKPEWTPKEFQSAKKVVKRYESVISVPEGGLSGIRALLIQKRNFLLLLLENPLLLEHESFTDLLWAFFHLMEELENRPSVAQLPATDLKHIEGDIRRAYGAVLREWIAYMEHLKEAYPYLYSLAVRMDPFDPNATPIVRS